MLGGRAAEELVLGRDTISTGASSDLAQAYDLSRRMITEWGFGSTLATHGNGGVTIGNAVSNSVDQEVEDLVDEAYSEALSRINGNLLCMTRIVSRLMKDKTIDGKTVRQIIRLSTLKSEPILLDM